MKEYKNILIIRTDRMGDVVLTTPSFKVARKNFPNSRISILVVPPMQELIEGNPYLDEIIIYDVGKEHRGIAGFWKLVYFLRRKKFDLAIIFHTKKWTNLLCFLVGISCRLGYRNDKWGFLLTHPVKDTRSLGVRHESDYCLDLLEQFGMKVEDKEFYVSVKEDAKRWNAERLAQLDIHENDRLIAIHPGASDPSRRWPAYLYAELINRLSVLYPSKFIIIGDPVIKDIVLKIKALVNQPVVDLTGQTTVSQFVGLIKRANLLISNDSGPVHVAVGLKTPVVSIFTRNQPGINPERWKPLGEKARFVAVPLDQSISFAKAGEIDPKYLELIKTEQVIEAVDAIFKLC